jgi:hypothetical protein
MKRACWPLLILATATSGLAQQPAYDPSRLIMSMGQPARYKWYAGLGAGAYRGDEDFATQARLGVYKDLMNPMLSALGFDLAGYVGSRGAELDGGFQALLQSPTLRLAFGFDYSFQEEEADAVLALVHPITRGGVPLSGGTIRVDWLPGRGNSWTVSATFPLGQPYAGRTRPESDEVPLPRAPSRPVSSTGEVPGLDAAMADVRDAVAWVARLTTPFIDQESMDDYRLVLDEIRFRLANPTALIEGAHTSEDETLAYHRALDHAFSIAVSEDAGSRGEATPLGREVAAQAREILLTEVFIPYNRTLGQKKESDTTLGLAVAARAGFAAWLARSAVPADRARAAASVFDGLLDIVEENRRALRERWEDSRFVWLPLRLALLPDQHDSQAELDSLLARFVDQRFIEGNRMWYVISEQFQWELARTIREARDYHVLWIHDVRGVNDEHKPDHLTLAHANFSYLTALTDRVREYDQTGTLPVYIVILDQWFYEANLSRHLLGLLEDPLNFRLDLPAGYETTEDSLVRHQADLRAAVAGSARLQADAARYGEEWLANRIKIHLNITNPADPTFWANELLPLIGLPDNIARDHRKLAFYDVTEEDPYRGMAIYTGMGVGEHYTGANWEDRAILAQGPVLLTLKDSARRLFLSEGFAEDEVPYPLWPKPKPADYDARIQAAIADSTRPARGRAMQVHNATGYGPKPVNVVKAILYTLMPKGSVVKIPDSLWNSPLWGSMLMGLSLRGGRVLVIAPTLRTAPSAGFPQMARAHDLLSRLVTFHQTLSPELAAAGGLLRVGLYNPGVHVNDIVGRTHMIRRTFGEEAWLRELYPFDPAVYEAVDEAVRRLDEAGLRPASGRASSEDEQPKLHLKANLFLTGEEWDGLMRRPEWAEIFRIYMEQRAYRTAHRMEYVPYNALADSLRKVTQPALADFAAGLTPEGRQRLAAYFIIGSHNQNYRSMVIDGEVAFVAAGVGALTGLIDFIVITGLTEWLDDLEELEEHLPKYEGLQRWFARWIRNQV